MPNWKESQDYYFWPCSPQEGTFSALMGFCYCWLPSVWHCASRTENCLESCMKYNRARAICCSTFQHDVYFEKKGKKIIVLGRKIPLTWISEHMLLVAVVFKNHCQYWWITYRGDKSLIIFIMIIITFKGRLMDTCCIFVAGEHAERQKVSSERNPEIPN